MAETLKSDFDVIRRNKVYEEVARQIERLILKKLRPGDKLPSERELTELLGVSRSSIRDGIRRLELVGLVEPRQGAGTVVLEISPEVLVSPLANASGNSVVLKVLDVIMDMLRETRARSLQTEGRPVKSFAGHRRILAAI